MIIGTPKEIKESEFRVGLTPSSAKEYILNGHTVYIEVDAGLESGFSNEDYLSVGCKILDSASEVWNKADLIIKVKEPLSSEYKYFREGLIIYTYLHLASNLELTKELLKKKVTAIAYETISEDGITLPCLRPMSEAAGRLSIIHYCVANMPSSVARITTEALNNVILNNGLLIANNGLEALKIEAIKRGINTFEGKVTNKGVAEAFDLKFGRL